MVLQVDHGMGQQKEEAETGQTSGPEPPGGLGSKAGVGG